MRNRADFLVVLIHNSCTIKRDTGDISIHEDNYVLMRSEKLRYHLKNVSFLCVENFTILAILK